MNLLSPTTVDAGLVTELPLGKTKRIKHAQGAILVCHVAGQVYALDDRCTHEDASLYLGCLKGERVHCSLHGGEFDVKTGAALTEPAEIALRTYPVQISDGRIFINLS